MYYTSKQNSNDYYSAYKEEMESRNSDQENNNLEKIIKTGLVIVSLGLVSLSVLYFLNYFSHDNQAKPTTISNTKMVNATIPLKREPTHVQLRAHDVQTPTTQESMNPTKPLSNSQVSNINPKDIELIVKIIMSQMNNTPEKTETESLEKELVAAEEQIGKEQTLKESNHYNKIVLSSSEKTNNDLVQLQQRLNDAFEGKSENDKDADYSKAISKEVATRSNEMRVIIVQEGDSLSKIAKKAYGNYDDYVKIYNANPEIVKNPDQIYAGQRLRIPS